MSTACELPVRLPRGFTDGGGGGEFDDFGRDRADDRLERRQRNLLEVCPWLAHTSFLFQREQYQACGDMGCLLKGANQREQRAGERRKLPPAGASLRPPAGRALTP